MFNKRSFGGLLLPIFNRIRLNCWCNVEMAEVVMWM